MSATKERTEKTMTDWQIVSRLLAYLKGESGLLLLTFLCLIVYGFTAAYSPSLMAKAVDENIVQGDYEGLVITIVMLVGLYILMILTMRYQLIWLGTLGQKVLVKLRLDLFVKLQRLPIGFYYKNEAGDLMSRLINDSSAVGQLFSQSIAQTLGSLVSLVAIVIAMFLMDWRMALSTFFVLPLMIYLSIYFSRKSRIAFARTRESLGELSSGIEENLRLIRESQSFARQAINVANFEVENADNRNANIEAIKITAAFSPTIDVLSTLAQVLVISVGGYLATKNLTTVGVVVAFLTYSQRFYRPIQVLSTFYTSFQSTLAAADRIFMVIDSEPEDHNVVEEHILEDVKGEIEFIDVTFSYVPGQPVLKNINFKAKQGETIALIGETGVGKSTTVNLIPRYYNIDSGDIKIDGKSIYDFTLPSLRSFMAEVPQSSYLFSETIAANISYGDQTPDRDKIIHAAKMAQAHDFISKLENGYDSLIGKEGTQLSQGQKQLICIARAIYADPTILMLDEATSSIDTQTERLVQDSIDSVLKGRTSFVIAHRLSTVQNADRIIVMGKEGIVEQGTHKELMNKEGGYYKNILESQQIS